MDKKNQAVAVNQVPTLGNSICVGKPILLTGVMIFLWRKASPLILIDYRKEYYR